MKVVRYALLVLPLLAAVACSKPKDKDDPETLAAKDPRTLPPDVYRKKQQLFADSVLNAASPAKDVASKLGKGYEVGATTLRDTIAVLANKSECFAQGRGIDPYLAGTVSAQVHMSVIGSDMISVAKAEWTSDAGNIVTACLNEKMRSWKFDPLYGKPATYVVQVQFR
jgi:hypothetical protein